MSRRVVLQSKLVLENAEELGSPVPNNDASVGICQDGNVDSDFAMLAVDGLLFALVFIPVLT